MLASLEPNIRGQTWVAPIWERIRMLATLGIELVGGTYLEAVVESLGFEC